MKTVGGVILKQKSLQTVGRTDGRWGRPFFKRAYKNQVNEICHIVFCRKASLKWREQFLGQIFACNSAFMLFWGILVIYGKGVWQVQIFLSPLYNFEVCK